MRKRQLPSLLLSYGSLPFNVTVFQTIVIDLTHSKISMHGVCLALDL